MVKRWLVMETENGDLRMPFATRLAGAGRHLPATHLTTTDLMSTTRHSTHIDLERLTGIRERRVSVGDEDSYTLAISGALDCLERSTGTPGRSMWWSVAASPSFTAVSPNGWNRR